MWQPRGIVGGRPEGDGEEILPVGAVEVEDLRPGGAMLQLIGGDADFG
jgi:hypothetical protein